jgi:pre-mRNA branch site protein p14
MNKKVSTKEQEEQLKNMQAKYGVDGQQHTKKESAK